MGPLGCSKGFWGYFMLPNPPSWFLAVSYLTGTDGPAPRAKMPMRDGVGVRTMGGMMGGARI